MADDSGDKTEAPTPKRREQARENGQIAQSKDLTSSMLLVGVTILLGTTGSQLVDSLRQLLALTLDGTISIRTDRDVVPVFTLAGTIVAGAMWPLLLGTVIIAIVANLIQVGFHPSTKRITPKFDFNPMKGLQKLFGGGGARGPVSFAMNLAKLLVVTFLVYTALHGKVDAIVGVAQLEPMQIFELCAGIVYDITLRIGIVLLILAIVDFGYQKFQ